MTSDNFDIPFIIQELRNLRSMIESGTRRNTKLARVSNAAPELGDLDFISPSPASTSGDPTDPEFTGSFHVGGGVLFPQGSMKFGAVEEGVLNFGVDEDGKVYANNIELALNGVDIEGAIVLKTIGWEVSQTAEANGETRNMRLGLADDGTYPKTRLEFSEPNTDVVTVPNGDFASNDMSDWTAMVGTWTGENGYGYGTAPTVAPKTTSENKIAITGGNTYTFAARCAATRTQEYGSAGNIVVTVQIDVKFYTAGDVLISTATVGTRRGSQYYPAPAELSLGSVTLGWGEITKNILVPATATKFEFVAYITAGGNSETLSVDDFTVVGVGREQALEFTDEGIFHESAIKSKRRMVGFAQPGQAQGYGVSALGSSTMSPIGTTQFGVGGTIGGLITNSGHVGRRFTTAAAANNVAGLSYWGQSVAWFTMNSKPYFSARFKSIEFLNFNIFAGIANSNPSAGALGTFYCGFKLVSDRWVGSYVASGVETNTGTSLPMYLCDTDYLMEFWIDSDTGIIYFSVNGVVASITISAGINVSTSVYPMLQIWNTEAAIKVIDIYNAYLELLPPVPSYDSALIQFQSRPAEANANDTYILSTAAGTNYATSSPIYIGESSTVAQLARALFKFDISSIPSDAEIVRAELRLSIANNFASEVGNFEVYRLLRDWVEAQATWNIWSTGNNWGSPGATSGTDIDTSIAWASTSFIVSEAGDSEKAFVLNVVEFQKMVDGTYANYGWLIREQAGFLNNQHSFHTSSATTLGLNPRLIVWYK